MKMITGIRQFGARVRRKTLSSLMALGAFCAVELVAQEVFEIDDSVRYSVRNALDLTYRDVHELPGGGFLVLGGLRYVDGVPVDGMARFTAGGALDPTFTPPYPGARITRCTVAGNDTVLILATVLNPGAPAQRLIQRLLPNGSIDPSYPSVNVIAFNITAMVGLGDGGCYLIHQAGPNSLRVLHVLANGQLNPSYNVGPLSGNFANAGAAGPNGELALWRSTGSGPAAVVTISPSGTVLPSFTGIPSTFRASAAVYEPAGALVLAGAHLPSASGPVLIRLLPSGARDTAFSGTVPFTSAVGSAVVRLADGSFVAVGSGVSTHPALLHFSASGAYLGGLSSSTIEGTNTGLSGLLARSVGDYLAYGRFLTLDGVATSRFARVAANRTVDPNFHVDIAMAGRVSALASYRDGLAVAGSFTELGAVDALNLAILGADDAFANVLPYFPPSTTRAVGTSDGGVILTGSLLIPSVTGSVARGVIKLNHDGSVAANFLPTIGQGTVEDAVSLADGRVLLAGRMTGLIGGVPVANLIRSNADGTLDPTFNHSSPLVGSGITALAIDAEGRILVAGIFSAIQGHARPGLARLDANGNVDPTFAPGIGVTGFPRTIRLLPDGSFYLVGVRSDAPQGTPSSLIRFNPDGSVGAEQLLSLSGASVANYELHPDGSIFLAGSLPDRGGGFWRVLPDGEIDPLFWATVDVGTNSPFFIDNDGRVVVGGVFTRVNGIPHEALMRFAPVPLDVVIEGPSTVRLLSETTFTAVVTGSRHPTTFQWFKDGEPIEGATGATLTLSHIVPKHEGNYVVQVTAANGTATSDPLALKVIRGIPAR